MLFIFASEIMQFCLLLLLEKCALLKGNQIGQIAKAKHSMLYFARAVNLVAQYEHFFEASVPLMSFIEFHK